MRHLLPRIIANITGAPRYFPTIEWSQTSYTHNLFRVYEYYFGRRFGGRAEVAAWLDSHGKQHIKCFTLEAFIHNRIEAPLRRLARRFSFSIVPAPRLITPTGYTFSPFLFAIAYDNSGQQAAASSSPTVSLAVSGSDREMVFFPYNNVSNGITGCTYNSVSASSVTSNNGFGGSFWVYAYHLIAPATGTNNAAAASSDANARLMVISYTGVDQTTPIDTSTVGNQDNVATHTMSITTGVADALIAAGVINNNGDANTSSDGNVRTHSGVGFSSVDKLTTTAGSNSVSISGAGFPASTDWFHVIISLKPAVAAASFIPRLMFL